MFVNDHLKIALIPSTLEVSVLFFFLNKRAALIYFLMKRSIFNMEKQFPKIDRKN